MLVLILFDNKTMLYLNKNKKQFGAFSHIYQTPSDLKTFFLLYLPADTQESVEGAIHKASKQLDLLPKMSRYCCPVEINFFSFIEI